MTMRRRGRAAVALTAAGLLVLTACTQVSPDGGTSDGGGTADGEITVGAGVTAEPCPDAVNADNGCIYLGVLSDLTEGPFAALAVPITDAQRAFWQKVNEDGGISGYDIDIDTYTRDTKYQAAEHAAQYQQIAGNIAGIAQSLGTVNTESVLPDMIERSLVTVPTSWWSGYAFDDNDGGLLLETGYSYCTEALVGLDWFSENHDAPATVQAVGYPGDYGGDSAEGVKRWAEVNGATALEAIGTGPNQVVGNQDAVVSAVLAGSPDVVVLAIGPAETAEIVGKLAAGGFSGRFLGALPTWNPALLDSAAAPALIGLFNHMSPYENWDGTSAAMDEIRESLGGELPTNGGYIIGWGIGYPLKAALEAAAEAGDLTPEGIAAVVEGLTVDFSGLLPEHTYGGDPQANANQAVNIGTPDPEVDLGIRTVDSFYTGTSFDQTDYSAACVATG
ncbi:ABC transporter substrate-binding protein [Microbacterium esteraromaticum]|uniref:ABC transporter substrate-binding protein n=1 Tax=Microbacterium esteraromaticum TaxID=57043 RepID=UPI001C95702C|nr:ABC transporter substrate-binding protein [Microbacterium esteraromaticum]MBY6060111.1 ABC transporter substrate-binding protein [Microbacterium esteraromaticum]